MKPLLPLLLLMMMMMIGCSSAPERITDMPESTPQRIMDIELLALDLSSCGRCTQTDRTMTEAIDAVAGLLRQTGTVVRTTRHVVATAEEAQRLRFASSPTIRIDGRDIAMTFRESRCEDCTDLCNRGGGDIDCRDWLWQGRVYTYAPKAMIIDALLKAYAAGPALPSDEPFELPANLRTFFSARVSQPATATTGFAALSSAECCDRSTCCEPSENAACCDTSAATARAESSKVPCGCK